MNSETDPELYRKLQKFGARDMEACMQCATCSASCPLSSGSNTFPRKIYRYLQLGLSDQLRRAPEPWLCYYCGECNTDCPRGAEPAETMMAARRWLTTEYDWTGLAKRFYLSEAWEIGALAVVAAGVVLLFWLFHGPIITDRVAVNTFAPVLWIEIGDLVMAAVLSIFLLSNAFRMFRLVMGPTRVPLSIYLREARTFLLHFLTQKRWRKCSQDRSRWLKHFILVTGYLTMMTLVIGCIRWFQVDDSSWHFTSLFGYYATAVLLFLTVEMFFSRRRRQETIHRYSELSDWLFLILLFATTLTGIVMHVVRLAGWPMGTYVMYVIHLAVAVPMLVIEVPFGKWSHLFYRPLAIYLATVKEKASVVSQVDVGEIRHRVGAAFDTCVQCGACTSNCPYTGVASFSPRNVLRQLNLGAATQASVDDAVWNCLTCGACAAICPRGVDIIDLMTAVRGLNMDGGRIPAYLAGSLESLQTAGNPLNGVPAKRPDWALDIDLPMMQPHHEYCLFTCCMTVYDDTPAQHNRRAGLALCRLLESANVTFGSLGTEQQCCGAPAGEVGAGDLEARLIAANTDAFVRAGVQKILTTSPHCLYALNRRYTDLSSAVDREHYVELLDRLTAGKQLLPKTAVSIVVTYHDPCYLGRHQGITDAPRRVLQRIPGLVLVEMANHKQNSLCCGGGGGGGWREVQKEHDFGAMRVDQALSSGAEIIATACPMCIRMLAAAIKRRGVSDQLVVRDVSELLLASVAPAQASVEYDSVAVESV